MKRFARGSRRRQFARMSDRDQSADKSHLAVGKSSAGLRLTRISTACSSFLISTSIFIFQFRFYKFQSKYFLNIYLIYLQYNILDVKRIPYFATSILTKTFCPANASESMPIILLLILLIRMTMNHGHGLPSFYM